MSHKYGIDKDRNPEGASPSKTLRVLSFTVQTDYDIYIDSDLENDEILSNFTSGSYSESDAVKLCSRIDVDSIKIGESYYWGGHK